MEKKDEFNGPIIRDGQEVDFNDVNIAQPIAKLHEGAEFKKYLKEHRLSIEEMAKKLGVTRQAIYLQMKRMYLSTQFKKKLSAIGVYPFHERSADLISPSGVAPLENLNRELLIKEIRRLQNIILLQAEHIGQMAKIK